MKGCELCDGVARMYCESDQASLCWECDAEVHGANFLVARHSRTLLCRSCQSPTPWKACGARLGPTVSVCERCCGVRLGGGKPVRSVEVEGEEGQDEIEGGEEGERDDIEAEDEGDEGDEEDEEAEEEGDGEGEGEEDGENQVVPWSLTPPPAASSSSSEESSNRMMSRGFLKRMRENADLFSPSQNDRPTSTSQPSYPAPAPSPSIPEAQATAEDEATSFRPSKDRKKTALLDVSASSALADLARRRHHCVKPTTTAPSPSALRDLCRPGAVDLVCSRSGSPPI